MRRSRNSLQQIYSSLFTIHSQWGNGVDEKDGENAMAIFVRSMAPARLNRSRTNARLATESSVFALLCATGLFSSYQAHSDATALVENPSPIDEIVVTAQKRVSTVQTTPISISAVSGDEPQPSFTRIETNQPLTAGVDLNYRF